MLLGLGLIQPLGGLGPWWSLIARGPVVVFIDDERQAWGDKRKKNYRRICWTNLTSQRKKEKNRGETEREGGRNGRAQRKIEMNDTVSTCQVCCSWEGKKRGAGGISV